MYSLRDISSGALVYMVYISQNCFSEKKEEASSERSKTTAGFFWAEERVSRTLEENTSITPKESLVSGP